MTSFIWPLIKRVLFRIRWASFMSISWAGNNIWGVNHRKGEVTLIAGVMAEAPLRCFLCQVQFLWLLLFRVGLNSRFMPRHKFGNIPCVWSAMNVAHKYLIEIKILLKDWVTLNFDFPMYVHRVSYIFNTFKANVRGGFEKFSKIDANKWICI